MDEEVRRGWTCSLDGRRLGAWTLSALPHAYSTYSPYPLQMSSPAVTQAVQLAAHAGLYHLSSRNLDDPALELRPIHRVAAAYLDMRTAHPVMLDSAKNDELLHALVALCAVAAHESAAAARTLVAHNSETLSHALGTVLSCLSTGGACFGEMQGVFIALRRALADLVVLDFALGPDPDGRQVVSVKMKVPVGETG